MKQQRILDYDLARVGISLMTNQSGWRCCSPKSAKSQFVETRCFPVLLWPAGILHYYGLYIALAKVLLTVSYCLPPLPVYMISATGPQHLSGPCADRYAFAGRAALSGGPYCGHGGPCCTHFLFICTGVFTSVAQHASKIRVGCIPQCRFSET